MGKDIVIGGPCPSGARMPLEYLRDRRSGQVAIGTLYTIAVRPTPFAYDESIFMAAALAIPLWIVLSVIVGAAPALAGQQVYIYSVVHPFYGEIGTLTDTVDRSPEVMRIDSRLRIPPSADILPPFSRSGTTATPAP